MKPNGITFTGADESTDPLALAEIANRFPHLMIEWGILFNTAKAGTGRYPSIKKIEAFSEATRKYGINLSAHICGELMRKTCAGDWSWAKEIDIYENYSFLDDFLRIQLNFSHEKKTQELITGLLPFLSTHQIIAQVRDFSDPVLSQYPFKPLLDKSGGRGILNTEWPKRPDNLDFVGYAGGLNADNIEEQLPLISTAANGNYWIDMENGVRTDDKFDLTKVVSVLEKIKI